MFLAVVALSQLLNVCAPNAGRRTMAAIVRVESDGNPLAMHDNNLNKTFVPKDVNQGVVWANELLALHHSVDLGISQVNSFNLPRLHLSVRDAFDACTNVHAGATILASDYRAAALQFGAGQFALRRAIGAYNTGSLYAGSTYIHRILEAAGVDADEGFPVPDLEAGSQPSTARDRRPVVPRDIRRAARVARAPARAADPFAAPLLVGASAARVPSNAPRQSNAAPRSGNADPAYAPILAATPAARRTPGPAVSPAPQPVPSASPMPAVPATAKPTPSRAPGS
jgi:type IV secretion system protein VirB1